MADVSLRSFRYNEHKKLTVTHPSLAHHRGLHLPLTHKQHCKYCRLNNVTNTDVISEMLGWQSQMVFWTQITPQDKNDGATGVHTYNPSASTPFSGQHQPERSSLQQPASFKGSGEGTTGTSNMSHFRHLKSLYQPSPTPSNWRVASAAYIAGEKSTSSQSSTKLRDINAKTRLPHISLMSWLPQSTLHTQSEETAKMQQQKPQGNFVLSYYNVYCVF